MTCTPTRPLPHPTPLTQPFWDGCRQAELRLQRCDACGCFRFFPSEACHLCGSPDCSWQAVPPRGSIYSWIVVHRAVDEAWADEVPFTVVVVRIDVPGKPLITGTLTGCAPHAVEAGMQVRAEFEPVSAEISLLRWRPV